MALDIFCRMSRDASERHPSAPQMMTARLWRSYSIPSRQWCRRRAIRSGHRECPNRPRNSRQEFPGILKFSNISIFTAWCYAIARYMLSLCVRPSVTSWSSTKMVKPGILQTTLYDSPGTLVYWRQRKTSAIFQRGIPSVARNGGGVGYNLQSTTLDQYLAISQKQRKIRIYM